ncbi:TrbC/VirB2 family protein [Tardibacter chloracetimidivorans]|uniref:TrbC/VirB2 family protein n=1 Tax=Tardibacter chloracetimidivorans TaxID=1921510 RepID=UPI001D04821B|nr:TrbC/VirB2 family protein [Tardibacter chloracetimidivorans]
MSVPTQPAAAKPDNRKSRLLASTALSSTLKVAATGLVLAPALALAAGSGMPWEEPLQQVLESVQGPVAKIVAVIIIIVTGLTLAFGETAGGFRRLIQIVFGLSIAFAASSFFLSFFSFGGGALIA